MDCEREMPSSEGRAGSLINGLASLSLCREQWRETPDDVKGRKATQTHETARWLRARMVIKEVGVRQACLTLIGADLRVWQRLRPRCLSMGGGWTLWCPVRLGWTQGLLGRRLSTGPH